MNAVEFRPIAATMQERWWAFPIPPAAFDAYVRDLADLPVEAVRTAVDAIAADGADRPPTSGQIRRRVAELELDAPDWDQVRTALARWRAARPDREQALESWTCPYGMCDGGGFVVDGQRARDCRCRPERIAARRGLGMLPAMVREFVAEGHVSPAEFDRMFAEGDATVEAQVRGRWREFVGRAVESRAFAGLPSAAGVARLESAREENARRELRRADLRRMDDARLLEVAAREAA